MRNFPCVHASWSEQRIENSAPRRKGAACHDEDAVCGPLRVISIILSNHIRDLFLCDLRVVGESPNDLFLCDLNRSGWSLDRFKSRVI